MDKNTRDVLIVVAVIAAAITLIVTGHGGWVILAAFVAWIGFSS